MLITNSKKASKKSIALAYKRMIEKLDGVINDNNDIIKPLTPLFQKIKSSTIDFQNSDNLNTGIAVTKWSIQNKLTQQAYTALEETIKTLIELVGELYIKEDKKGSYNFNMILCVNFLFY
jgi:uncharacterized Tic20 family protein